MSWYHTICMLKVSIMFSLFILALGAVIPVFFRAFALVFEQRYEKPSHWTQDLRKDGENVTVSHFIQVFTFLPYNAQLLINFLLTHSVFSNKPQCVDTTPLGRQVYCCVYFFLEFKCTFVQPSKTCTESSDLTFVFYRLLFRVWLS